MLKKRLLSVMLVGVMTFNMSFSACASQSQCNDVNHAMDSITENSCYSEYNYVGTSIQEISNIKINDKTLVSNRLISPDGSFVMYVSDGIESNTIYGNVSFEMFKEITDEYILRNNTVMPLGSDLTGSQYKHIYVGSSGTKTFDSAQISKVNNELSAYSILATFFSWPGAVLTAGASFLLSVINSKSPAKVVITSSTYEIVTSYDNTYLFHCYHQTIKSYDSGGHYLGSETDYVQVIGG